VGNPATKCNETKWHLLKERKKERNTQTNIKTKTTDATIYFILKILFADFGYYLVCSWTIPNYFLHLEIFLAFH
jgi:hypothetical protein